MLTKKEFNKAVGKEKNTKSESPSSLPQKVDQKTRVTIKYDVGYPNQLYIRGKGANLSWDKGQLLQNRGSDEWIWETEVQFPQCEFKVLINDRMYEIGENHIINSGASILYTPRF